MVFWFFKYMYIIYLSSKIYIIQVVYLFVSSALIEKCSILLSNIFDNNKDERPAK